MNVSSNFIRFALAATFAAASFACAADETVVVTKTVDGVTWVYTVNKTQKTIAMGANPSSLNLGGSDNPSYKSVRAVDIYFTTDVLQIPDSFEYEGESYPVTVIGNRAFIRCEKLGAIWMPRRLNYMWNCSMYQTTGTKTVWFRGPEENADNELQEYVTLKGQGADHFNLASGVKCALIGPYVKKGDTNLTFRAATGLTAYLPRHGGNTTWNTVDMLGTSPTYVYYKSLDETAKTITFAPTNATELATAMASAALIKNSLDFDTVIANDIGVDAEVSGGDAALAYVTFASKGRVTFSVTTQAQMDTVCGALSTGSQAIIDATSATQNIRVPAGYDIEVLAPASGKVEWQYCGVMIIVE